MITVVSIALYALSVFFAASLGVTTEQNRNGNAEKSSAALSVTLTVIPFVLAAVLQVFA